MNVKLPLIITSASVAALMGATTQAATVGAALDYAQDIDIIGLFTGSGVGTGSGSFDTNGELTVASEVATSIPALGLPGTVTASSVYSGSIVGNLWTYSGTSQTTFAGCTGNGALCSNVTLGTGALSTGNAVFTLDILTGGSWFTSSTIATISTLNVDHSLAVAAVPVPAAAWLFGSALLGLAGVARKRKA
jgi:hypothetical protein